MTKNKDKRNIYFIGIGGIGMSALARYFIDMGYKVAGYDKVRTQITDDLEKLGAKIYYQDDIALIPKPFKDKDFTTVIYTPAIPPENTILSFFKNNDFEVKKRSDILADITRENKTIAIAGTHGKTSISAMIAHILYEAGILKAGFIGGIVNNYNSNYIKGKNTGFVVVEADEYDRTFLKLSPDIALVSALDIDHLDIYKNKENLTQAFENFLKLVPENGLKILNKQISLNIEKYYTYSGTAPADFYADNPFIFKGIQEFNIYTPEGIIEDVQLALPGRVNVENAIAAASIATLLRVDPDTIADALYSFKGVQRRFQKLFDNGKKIFYTDYAHLPQEISALKQAIEEFYINRKILAIFQPHLYSRTKDLADEFAAVLDTFPNVILAPIYPAREKPIPGVDSDLILRKMKNKNAQVIPLSQIPQKIKNYDFDIILTIGAGDIVNINPQIVQILTSL